jgi:hypothetical protein
MLLSGNTDVAFPSMTATTTPAACLPTPAIAAATTNTAAVPTIRAASTADASTVANVATPTTSQRRRTSPQYHSA